MRRYKYTLAARVFVLQNTIVFGSSLGSLRHSARFPRSFCKKSNKFIQKLHTGQNLALLMAVVQASWTLELQALDLRFRVYKPNGVSFKLASLTKKRIPGLPPKELFFGAFSKDKHLCVVEC